MSVNTFRHPLTILRQLDIELDDHGHNVADWEEVGMVFASISQTSGDETTENRRKNHAEIVEVRCLYHPQIDATAKLQDVSGTIYNVLGIDNVDKRSIELVITAGKSNG